MNKSTIKTWGYNIAYISCVLLLLIFPVFIYSIKTTDVSFFITSFLFALPLCGLLWMIKNRVANSIIVAIFTLFSMTETVMVVGFNSFIMTGNLLAMLTTTGQESLSFLQNNLSSGMYLLAELIFCIGAIWTSKHLLKNSAVKFLFVASTFVLSSCFICYKLVGFYQNKITLRYYVVNRILTRPPYNMPYQFFNLTQRIKIDRYKKEAESFTFNSTRDIDLQDNEIYVLAIGESLRYANLSLNGHYQRETTPLLEATDNLILFNDYYSTACLTMYSVPQIVTRATPETYELNYKEKSIFLPYKENGFKTICIANARNLLSYERYLTNGIDELLTADDDKTICRMVDSIANIYPKLFLMIEFLGNHSYYYNYEKEYDVYHPNINTDKDVKSDSLYINAYDNTILYHDFILSTIIKSINRPNTISGFLFVSDHGENVTATGGGHGGDCRPQKTEYHVPMIWWCSEVYLSLFPNKVRAANNNKDKPINANIVFGSMCDMASIVINRGEERNQNSIFNDSLIVEPRTVLLPDGISVWPVE